MATRASTIKRVEYTRRTGSQSTYVIEADRHGSAWIYLGDKLIKQLPMGDHFGRSRWGSKAEQERAIAYARAVIESFLTDEG